MTNSNQSNLSTGDLLRALARHSKKAFLMFCLVVAATIGWIVFAPKKYESFASVYVRVGHENNTLDPSATTGQTLNIQQTLEAEINSMLRIIESRETASLVASSVGVDTILANDLVDSSSGQPATKKSALDSLKSWVSKMRDLVPKRFSESREEAAVRLLRDRSSFGAPKKSNVIEISCKAGHPKLAQTIASSWTEAFIEEHLRVSRTEGSYYFFNQQTREIEERLLTVEQALKEAKSSAGLVSILGQQQLLEEQSNAIRSRSLINRSLLDAAQAKSAKLEKIVETLPQRVEIDQITAQSHEGWNELRTKLFELQIREQELRAKYSATSPDVVAVERQREQVEKILASLDKSSSETVKGPNPTYRMFQQSLLNEQALVVSLSAEKHSLDSQLKSNLEEQKTLNESAVVIAELERQRLNLDTAYRASAARTEQARTLQAMETANISSVSKLQHASYSSIPVGLGRLKTLLLGLILAAMAAAGYVVIAEYFSRTFVTPSQVEHSLELPVLVSIPQHRRQSRRASY